MTKITFTESPVHKTHNDSPTTPKPQIIPKGQKAIKMLTTDKKVILGLHPIRYGNNNITEAFTKKEIGFELEVRTGNSAHREILNLEMVIKLKEQIEKSLESYDEFMNYDSTTSI